MKKQCLWLLFLALVLVLLPGLMLGEEAPAESGPDMPAPPDAPPGAPPGAQKEQTKKKKYLVE